MPRDNAPVVHQGYSEDALAALEGAKPEEQRFALALAMGKNATQAFLECIPNATNYSQTGLWSEASKLKRSDKVRFWVREYVLAGAQHGKRTIEQHVGRLTELSLEAQETGNYGAAVNAEVNAGKASGLYVDKVEDVTPRSEPDKLTEILGSKLAGKLLARQDVAEDDEA